MKKLFVFLLAVRYCLTSFAVEPASSWLMSPYGTLRCSKIRTGPYRLHVALQNGNRLVVPVKQIISYSIQGKVFNKLPLYKNGRPTGRQDFMELVTTSGKLNIYRYGRCTSRFESPTKTVYNYYVYNGDKLQSFTNEKEFPVYGKRVDLQYAVK